MKITMIAALFALFACAAWAGNNDHNGNSTAKGQEMDNAAQTLQQIGNSNEIPKGLLNSAQCIAVVPSLTKAGFIAGGEHGSGVVSCRASQGWSAPAFFSISGGSIGLQAGAQRSKIVLLMNQQGKDYLLNGNFKLSAQAVAAGPTSKEGNSSAKWTAPVLSYKNSGGLYAGASIQGSTIQVDNDAIHQVYGQNVSARQVLDGSVRTPQDAQGFMSALRQVA